MLLWSLETTENAMQSAKNVCHLLGRIHIKNCHTHLDEFLRQPICKQLPLTPLMLAIMNPPNMQKGVEHLTLAVEGGYFATMLDLAETHNTDFQNDPFVKDKAKAECWFQRALGKVNRVFPLAFTHYGEFLKWDGRFQEARNMFMVAANFGHAKGQCECTQSLLNRSGGDTSDQTNNHRQKTCAATNSKDCTKAVKWLCGTSTKGFCVPMDILLAKTLIEITEKARRTANTVGKSPFPRVSQIPLLAKKGGYRSSEELQKQVDELEK